MTVHVVRSTGRVGIGRISGIRICVYFASQSVYLPIWKKALELIQNVKQPNIIEIGCGVGQFANMLFHYSLYNYKGLDFSKDWPKWNY